MALNQPIKQTENYVILTLLLTEDFLVNLLSAKQQNHYFKTFSPYQSL